MKTAITSLLVVLAVVIILTIGYFIGNSSKPTSFIFQAIPVPPPFLEQDYNRSPKCPDLSKYFGS